LDDKEKFGYASDNDLLAGSVDSGSSGHSSGDRVETSRSAGTWSLLNLDSTGYEDTRKYIRTAPAANVRRILKERGIDGDFAHMNGVWKSGRATRRTLRASRFRRRRRKS